MSWTFERFGWDRDNDRPLIEVLPLGAPGGVVVKIVALGADDEHADTMFALKDGDDCLKEAWRPEPMQVVFLEAMLAAGPEEFGRYTLAVGAGGRLGRDVTAERLREVIEAIEAAETGYFETYSR